MGNNKIPTSVNIFDEEWQAHAHGTHFEWSMNLQMCSTDSAAHLLSMLESLVDPAQLYLPVEFFHIIYIYVNAYTI